MSNRNRNRTWSRLNPHNTRTRSSGSKQETRRYSTSQAVSQDTKYHMQSSMSPSFSSSSASGERGWDYLLRRKAEYINDRIHKAKAAGVAGTTEVFLRFPIKEEPSSPKRNESTYSLSQMTPSLPGMDASQSANEGFWIDTTGDGYREQNETRQTLSRRADHYIKTEAPWNYPEPTVESYGVLHSSEDTGQSYGINTTAYQLPDQTVSQSLPNDREDTRCDTKQGLKRKFNVLSNSLSVQMLVANIRNAVATNPNFKRSKHDSAANQTLGHNERNGIGDASCTSEQSFMENNWANHEFEQTLSHHMASVMKDSQESTELDFKGNRRDSVANQTLACNTPNDGRDVNHSTKQDFGGNKPNSASNKTLIHTLPYPAEGVEVVYTVDPVEAEAWLRNNIIDCSAQAVGFDIEWKPQYVSKKKGGVENKTAVLQLGVESSCLVLHLYNMKSPPQLLRSVLNDKKILKVGSGILQDVVKLKRDTGLICLGMVDTQKMAKSMGTNAPRKLGLKALAQHFLGINLEKPKSVSRSNWENYPLTIRQIHYAALDAWIGLKIYQRMKLEIGQGQAHTNETQLVDDEAEEKSAVIHTLPYPAEGVETVYTADPVEAETWLKNNIIDSSAQAVGLDIKFKPEFVSIKKGMEKKTAVVVLGVESSCLVLHLCGMKSPPQLLRSILNDKKILKVGNAISQDVTKLQRDTGLTCKGIVNTQEMAKSMGTSAPPKLGFKALAEHFLGIKLEKSPKSVAKKNWEKYPLKMRQIHYAAIDAWIVFKIYQHIKLVKEQHQTHINETQLVDDEAEEKSGKIVKCHVCKKKLKSQNALSNHIKIHAQCKCGMFFQDKISKMHRLFCPEVNPVTPLDQADDDSIFHCQACGKRCKSAEKLMMHIKEVGHVRCPFCTRLLKGPQCTSHIRRCRQFSGQWTQKQVLHSECD
ncbi:uncharacterized protein LOC110054354 [Orbicella faveolata]|uniref:uncharacterized protein LOC110054354 n=1 Tax=Orbicella faveolata TaxID=48498 RepID=UPI0009E53F50|nr:uncharacterized protein LOC110054354 [Orbicella faveolata]